MKALALGKSIEIPHAEVYDFGTNPFTATAVICPKAIKSSSSPGGGKKPAIATGTIISNRSYLSGTSIHDYHSYLDYVKTFPPPGGQTEIEKYVKKNYSYVKNFEEGLDIGDWTFSIISQRTGPNLSDEYFLRFNLRRLHGYRTGGVGYDLLARIPNFYQDKKGTADNDKETLDKLRAEYAYHVAAVRDTKGEMRLYLNGYLLAEVSLNVENNGGFETYQIKTLVKKDVSMPSQYIVLRKQDGKTEIKLEKAGDPEKTLLAPESSTTFWKYDEAKYQEYRQLAGNANTPFKELRIYKEENSGDDAQQTTLSIKVDGKLMLSYRPVSTPITNVTNTCKLKIGGFTPLSFSTELKGFMQNVSLWNRALSQEDIIEFMNPNATYTPYIKNTNLEGGGIRFNPATKTGWITANAKMKYEDINSWNTYEETGTYDGDTGIAEQAEIIAKQTELTIEAYKQAKIDAASKVIAQTGASAQYSYDGDTEKLSYSKEEELNGCVGFWKFDDNGNDSSGTGNHVPESESMAFQEPKVVLPFFMEEQKADYWCWAASSTSAAKYFNPLTQWKQCSLAQEALKNHGPSMDPPITVSDECNCCKNTAADPQNNFQTSAECDKAFELFFGLKVAGYHFHRQKPYMNDNLRAFDDALIEEIKSELFHRRPIGVNVLWGGPGTAAEPNADGPAHFVFIIGITEGTQEDNFVIADSFNGISIVPQSHFPSRYKQAGSSIQALYLTKS